MSGQLHRIVGIDCHIERNSDEWMEKLTRIIEGQADSAHLIDRIEVGTVWSAMPRITYFLGNHVTVSVGKDHAPGQIADILARNNAVVEAHVRNSMEAPDIDRVDAMLAIRYAGRGVLSRMAAPQMNRLMINVPAGDYADCITRPTTEVKFKDGRMQRTGRRVSTTFWLNDGGRQAWDNRSLLVPMRKTLPEALIIAMAGRALDDVVGGTMLSGFGMTIRKAWVNGGQIGFSFEADVIPFDEALALRPYDLPKAA